MGQEILCLYLFAHVNNAHVQLLHVTMFVCTRLCVAKIMCKNKVISSESFKYMVSYTCKLAKSVV